MSDEVITQEIQTSVKSEVEVLDYVNYYDNTGEAYLAQVIKTNKDGSVELFVFNFSEKVTGVNHSSKLTRKIKDADGNNTDNAYFAYSFR